MSRKNGETIYLFFKTDQRQKKPGHEVNDNTDLVVIIPIVLQKISARHLNREIWNVI